MKSMYLIALVTSDLSRKNLSLCLKEGTAQKSSPS